MIDEGACSGQPPENWDADASLTIKRASGRVCWNECPIREECRDDAQRTKANGVIRGGYVWDCGRPKHTEEVYMRTQRTNTPTES
jgi:hypothetical protein